MWDALRHFEPYARSLSRRYRPYGRAAADKQDVFQEAMIAAWRAVEDYDGRGDLGGFVKQRMKYRVIDFVRVRWREETKPCGNAPKGRADREAVSLSEWDARGPDATVATVMAREDLRLLADALRELPPVQRSRLMGRANGLSRREMSAASGCTLTAIDRSLWKAWRQLELVFARRAQGLSAA